MTFGTVHHRGSKPVSEGTLDMSSKESKLPGTVAMVAVLGLPCIDRVGCLTCCLECSTVDHDVSPGLTRVVC